MNDAHTIRIEKTIQSFPNIETSQLKTKSLPSNTFYVSGLIIFKNGHQLAFTEVHKGDVANKLKYRYQYMDERSLMIFRYDNAFHHKEIDTYPHHKHTTTKIIAATEPTLHEILIEITQLQLVHSGQ